ncbi:MAG: hypothetical protein KGL90_10615 [Burkholderiales bacterium]|nr:hypothetical protein [Burkholderiales bacterium]
MHRCLVTAAAIVALAAPLLAPLSAQAQQQVQRNFPANALRGTLTVSAPPDVLLNGEAARLAPGARIRGQNNMLLMSGAVTGQELIVNYTTEQYGLVHDVWVLRDEEIAKRWPKSQEEAAKWTFDPIGQTWTKP